MEEDLLQKSEANNRPKPTQPCLNCGEEIGVLSGNVEAICKNCGWKDPCCE